MYELIRQTIHYSLHLIFPGIIAVVFFKEFWKKTWLIFLSTMLLDLDHLLSTPIFDPNRCSINFHYLHTYYAAFFYFIILLSKRLRLFGIGAIFHLLTDLEDCLWI